MQFPDPLNEPAPRPEAADWLAWAEHATDALAIGQVAAEGHGAPWQLLHANAALRRLTGDGLQPGQAFDGVAGALDLPLPRWAAACAALQATGQPAALELHAPGPQRWWRVALSRLGSRQVVAVLHDITEAKRIEASLARSKTAFDKLQAIAQVGSWELDTGTGRMRWSDQMHRVYGQAPGAPMDGLQDALNLVLPDDRPFTLAAIEAALQQGTPLDITHRVMGAAGTIRHVRLRGAPSRMAQGRPLSYRGTAQDTTTQVLTEARLLADQRRAAGVLQAMAEGLVVQAADGQVVEANAAAQTILGLTRDQVLGRTSADPRWQAVHEDGSPFPGDQHPSSRCLRSGQPLRGQVMGIDAPGQGRRWISINASPIQGSTPQRPAGVVTTFIDITEQRALQARLALAAAELSDLYEHTPCGLHSVDARGLYLRINDTALGWLGCERSELIGKLGPADFMTAQGRALFEARFPQTMRDGHVEGLEFDLLHRDGSLRRVRASATAVLDEAGRFLKTRTVLFDMTAGRGG